MAKNTAADNEQERKNFYDALSECFDALEEAYWAASTLPLKDRIQGCMSYVSKLSDILLLQDLASRNAELARLGDEIKLGNDKLEKLQEEIKNLIDKINTATKVAATIGKVLSFAKFLPV